MLYHHTPDMPIQFLLVFLYDSRKGLFPGGRIPELQKQLSILDSHPHEVSYLFFLPMTFSAAVTILGVSSPYLTISSAGVPLSPNVSLVPTYSIGAGKWRARV